MQSNLYSRFGKDIILPITFIPIHININDYLDPTIVTLNSPTSFYRLTHRFITFYFDKESAQII